VTSREGRLLALVVLTLLSAGCGDDDDDGVDDQAVLKVEPTDEESVCLQVADTLPPEVETLPVTSCDGPHTHEVYATVEAQDQIFPGVAALGETAEVKCLEEFEPFVGASPFDSQLSYSWLVPTLQSWNEEKDHNILCVLMRRDGAPLTGSMRHTGT
jgi:hypothetical protein